MSFAAPRVPINYLLIESLQKYPHYYGDDFKVECPTRSGRLLTLKEIANELSLRLIRIWLRDSMEKGPSRARAGERCTKSSTRIVIGFTNISMETPVPVWALRIKPAGPVRSPN